MLKLVIANKHGCNYKNKRTVLLVLILATQVMCLADITTKVDTVLERIFRTETFYTEFSLGFSETNLEKVFRNHKIL